MEIGELSGVMLVVAAVALVLALVVYLLPALIAAYRGHRDTVAISVLTILLGWSLIAWIIALVWALSPVQPRDSFPTASPTA